MMDINTAVYTKVLCNTTSFTHHPFLLKAIFPLIKRPAYSAMPNCSWG